MRELFSSFIPSFVNKMISYFQFGVFWKETFYFFKISLDIFIISKIRKYNNIPSLISTNIDIELLKKIHSAGIQIQTNAILINFLRSFISFFILSSFLSFSLLYIMFFIRSFILSDYGRGHRYPHPENQAHADSLWRCRIVHRDDPSSSSYKWDRT